MVGYEIIEYPIVSFTDLDLLLRYTKFWLMLNTNCYNFGDVNHGPSMLGINKSDTLDPNGSTSESGKIYGVAVNVERETKTPLTVAILCRDKM